MECVLNCWDSNLQEAAAHRVEHRPFPSLDEVDVHINVVTSTLGTGVRKRLCLCFMCRLCTCAIFVCFVCMCCVLHVCALCGIRLPPRLRGCCERVLTP